MLFVDLLVFSFQINCNVFVLLASTRLEANLVINVCK